MGIIGSLLGLAGGLGLFMFGMQLCSEGLQKVAARRLKTIVKVLTSNPLIGLGLGAAVTLGLQSSSATSALVVGLVSAGMMSLAQALGVLLGSALGASLTAQLIAFRPSGLAFFFLFTGSALYLLAKRSRWRGYGQVVLGFGLIFFGMITMSSSMAPIRDYPLVAQAMVALARFPLLEFLVGLVLTAVIQSSPAFLALLMTLAGHGLVQATAIVPYVLGAHVGGTVTGLISSFGAPGLDAKRAAAANFLFKLINGLVCLPFYQLLTGLVLWSSPDTGRQVANAHTLFSLVMAVGFLPLTPWVAGVMRRVIPDRRPGLGEATLLDETLLEVPEMAINQAQQQTLAMGRLVRDEMLGRVLPAVRFGADEVIDEIAEIEPAIDTLYKKISGYLTKLGGNSLSDELMQQSIQVLYAANDLEHIGDIMMNVAQIARKIKAEELEFSEEGAEEIEALLAQVCGNFTAALKALADNDRELASQIMRGRPKILRLEKELRFNHFDRMQSGNARTAATSAIHLDLIEALLRIDGHTVNIAQGVLGFI